MESTNTIKPSSHALYVGDLAPEVSEPHLFETFSTIGNIVSVRVCRDLVTRKSLGYGYVNFHTAEDAEKALRQLNCTLIRGRPCRIMRSNPEPTKRRSGEGNLVVKNLDKAVTDREFFDFFSKYGSVLSSKISRDHATGESRGYGFVQFEREEDAQSALGASGQALRGTPMTVEAFINKNDRVKAEIPVTNLYIKNFPVEWTETTINALFGKFDEVTSSHMATDPKGRRFAFINLATPEGATNALNALNGRVCKVDGTMKTPEEETEEEKAVEPIVDGPRTKKEDLPVVTNNIYRLYVSRAQTRAQRELELRKQFHTEERKQEGITLYVKNLHDQCTNEELKELFSRAGDVLAAHVAMTHAPSKVSRGFGFVTMANKEAATKAIAQLNALQYKGKPLFVCLHEKREDRARRLHEEQQRQLAGPLAAGFNRFNQNNRRGPNRFQNHAVPHVPPAAAAMSMNWYMQQAAILRQNPHGAHPQARAPTHPSDIRAYVESLEDGHRRDLLGNMLYPRIAQTHPTEAAKITGMILEMETSELISLLEDNAKLQTKVQEALHVLENAKNA